MHRRTLLRSALALTAAPWGATRAAASPAPLTTLGAAQPFDTAWLKGQARALAAKPYVAPSTSLPAALAHLDYDRFQSLRFKPEHSLWADRTTRFRAQFFHRGFLFKERVRIFEVVDGNARELAYDPALFDLSHSGLDARALPRDLGFAGFRVQHHQDWASDVTAFLGASYFRAVGADRQYGLSARGLAIDFGGAKGEEFPRFTHFWLERPSPTSGVMTIHALLDSPSIAGALRIDLQPGGATIMDIDAALYPRTPIDRLGIAPLTSMFYVGENDHRMGNDWRPEIHDSDGLAVQTGTGEWLWRPLTNPAGVRLNSFVDRNPRGFGLVQRDRVWDHYQDDGAVYDRRPDVWVTPKALSANGWGAGSIQLLELPAPDETYDNIVAAWVPDDKPQPGQELLFSYRLHWGVRLPVDPPLARVIATRQGIGGVVGQPRKAFTWRFVVDFEGGLLPSLVKRAQVHQPAHVEALITASRGQLELVSARPQFETGGYRAMFDLKPTDDSPEPIDLRLVLRLDGEVLSETWLSQYLPPPRATRERLVKEG